MVSFDELVSGFRKIGLKRGDIVLVHNSFKSFGGVEGGPQAVIRALLKVLGQEGTLVMPTFNFSFCDDFNRTGKGFFDLNETPSKMGVMTEMVRKMPGAIRSANPIYSVAALGKRAKGLTRIEDKNVFGRKSVFGKLYDLGAKIMVIGLSYNGSMTFFHYIEQMEGCDYRYPKKFSGVIKVGDKTYDDTFTMAVRSEGVETDVDAMGKVLEKNGVVKKTVIGQSEIKLMKARDVYKVTSREMKKNPKLLYSKVDTKKTSQEMMQLMKDLFPICRSITGDGVRETFKIISEQIPLKITEVKTGTKVFDWTIPREWNIKDAYIKNSKGKRIVDFKKSNLHILNYSVPVKKKISLKELKDHLYTLPEYPDWIPYLTSYYNDNWGFCLSQKQFNCLKADTYDILIDSTLGDGKLTYGELLIKGESEQEILFSSYICHPSLANDNLSGPVLLVYLAQELQKMKLKYSYRFLFVPETIGAITWLEKNEKALPKIKGGLVVTCVGDRGKMMYQRSRDGNALIDRAVEKVLMDANKKFEAFDYAPTGSDERQFSSPGFNLQMGSLMRTMYGQFPEYHTSADNLDLIDEKSFADSLNKYLDVVFILENDGTFKNQNPKCEPQLGKRGLYSAIGSQKNQGVIESAIIWVLNQSDGSNSLLDIAINSKISFKDIKIASDALIDKGLLKRVEKSDKRNRCASH